MRNFVVPYYGNKYKEAKEALAAAKIEWKSITHVIEPFCGGAGFSRYIAANIPEYTGEFLWCDVDPGLIGFMQIIIDGDFPALLAETKEEAKAITTKEAFREYRDKQDQTTGKGYFKNKRIRGSFREDLFNKENVERFVSSKQDHTKLIDFMKARVKVKCQPAEKTFQEAPATALIFSDPPYFQSCNSFYNACDEKVVLGADTNRHEDSDTSGMFVDILHGMQSPAINICVLNHSHLMAELYKGYVAKIYLKVYSQQHKDKKTGKCYMKQSKHMILCNRPSSSESSELHDTVVLDTSPLLSTE
jgi:site-specific DNA-adenine methylase